ncbi:MAG: cache domain-containing protein, partial [Acetatifactor sp.]|nr:cache domain-containing protein [Acetatifactor sp.]
MNKKYTVRRQIKLLVTGAVFLATLIVGFDAMILSYKTVRKDYIRTAESATSHLLRTLENGGDAWYYDGETGKVYVGDEEISPQLFDAVNEGNVAVKHTIFKDDLRVLTNIRKENGEYATGTKADADIYAIVKTGKTFTKNGVDIIDDRYTVCYMPIYSEGQFWGMMFTGVSHSALSAESSQMMLIIVCGIVFSLIAVYIISSIIMKKMADKLVKSISSGYNQLIEFSGQIQELSGKTTAGTTDIIKAMNNVADGATGQAAATQEAMASTEAFTQSIDVVNYEIRESKDYLNK